MSRKALIVLAIAALMVASLVGYRRWAATKTACDTAAVAATPPPSLPDFKVEASCGPGAAPAPAAKPKR